MNAPENLQWLSIPCHRDKDKTTPARKRLLQKQMSGAFISLEEYKETIRKYER